MHSLEDPSCSSPKCGLAMELTLSVVASDIRISEAHRPPEGPVGVPRCLEWHSDSFCRAHLGRTQPGYDIIPILEYGVMIHADCLSSASSIPLTSLCEVLMNIKPLECPFGVSAGQ